jgi:hypothetical protein
LPRHLHMQVDAVQQWAGDTALVAGDQVRRAMTAAARVAEVAAGAGMRCLFAICSSLA